MKLLVILAVLANLAFAQVDLTIFNDFTRSQVDVVGDASWGLSSTNHADLTLPETGAAGGFWISSPQAILLDWTMRFAFRIDEPVGEIPVSGSGIVFALQTMGPEYIAGSPSQANYAFFENNPGGSYFAIEFDANSDGWKSEDDSGSHFAVWENDSQVVHNDSASLPIWDTGLDHAITLAYTADDTTLKMYVDDALSRVATVDFAGIFGSTLVSIDSPRVPVGTKGAYMGFMAANPGDRGFGHKILSVQVVFDSISPPPDQNQVLSTIILVFLSLVGIFIATCIVVYHRVKYPLVFAPAVNDQILSTIKVPPGQQTRPISTSNSSSGSRGSRGSKGSRSKRHSKSSRGSKGSRGSRHSKGSRGGKKRASSRH